MDGRRRRGAPVSARNGGASDARINSDSTLANSRVSSPCILCERTASNGTALRMARHLPARTYLVGLVGPASNLAVWIGETYLQLQPWWPKVPWLTIWIASGAFLAGLVVQDCRHPESWLGQLWRDWTRAFTIVAATAQHEHQPLRFEAWTKLQITRRIDRGLLTVVAHSCTGKKRPPRLILLHSETRTFERGEVIRITLAHIPEPLKGWTPDVVEEWARFDPGNKNRWVIGQSDNVVEITLGRGIRKQRERFLLSKADPPSPLFLHRHEDGRYDL